VRPVTIADSQDLFTWRNDAHTRLMSKNSLPVTITEHEHWFTTTLSKNNKCLLICINPQHEKLGMVRFDMSGKTTEISINIAPKQRGKGLAIACLNNAVQYFKNNYSNYKILTANIKNSNLASQKCFTAIGFNLTTTRNDMNYYTLKL
ncbi:MAG: GNAT family N-acetyltransferase, partial [Legionellales bacterium]|nr:GNAT family N-acetyltransferase [Legionellales bacterium]